MSRHLDLDALSDLLVGEGSTTQADHLAGCAGCRAALAGLEEAQEPVRAALAGLPLPPVPADLPARIDAALLRAGEVRHGDDLAARRAGRAGGRAWWLLPAAAAAVAVGVVAGAVQGLSSGSSDSSTSAGGASSGLALAPESAPAPVATSGTGVDYSSADTLRAALPALLTGNAPGTARSTPDPAAAGPGPDGPDGPDGLARLHDPAALADCVAGLLAGGAPDAGPVALDYARWAGRPALVVVLTTDRPDVLDVFVVGPACRSGAEAVLSFSRLARPA